MDSAHLHSVSALKNDVIFRNPLTLNQKLQRGVHSHPPGKRFDSTNLRQIGISYLFWNNFPVPRRAELCGYGDNVIRKHPSENECAVFGGNDFETAAFFARTERRMIVTETDEALVELGEIIFLPSRNRVFFKEEETVVPTHLLSGVNQRLSGRKRECEHRHQLRSIAHSLKLCPRPRILVVVGSEHKTESILRKTLRVTADVVKKFGNILSSLSDVVQQVVEFPSVGCVET